MAYKVKWSDEAIISFEGSIKYLETNFSNREINNFIKATNDKIKFIESNPLMYRKSSRTDNIHYTNILGKVILVYRIKPRFKVVELIHFWDGRQNPKDLRYKKSEKYSFRSSLFYCTTSTHFPLTPLLMLLSYIASHNVPGQ